MKKTLILFIIFVSLLSANRAEAQFGGLVTEIGPNVWTNTASTAESIWQTAAKDILEPAVKQLAERAFDKVVDQTLNWAAEGFDGQPGFINNWDDFLKGTEYDVLNDAFTLANETYSNVTGAVSDQCLSEIENHQAIAADIWDTLSDSVKSNYANEEEYVNDYVQANVSSGCQFATGSGGGSGGTAQQNYNLYNSQGFASGKNIVTTIAQYGAKKLNYDPVSAIINQEEETLTELLGSPQAKEEFRTNFSTGGWLGYIALADPNNTAIGVQDLTQAALLQQSSETIKNAIDDQQTPVKFLSKTECLETSNKTGDCIKEAIVTPAVQVSEKVTNALLKDEKLAESADGLIGTLISSAVGKITDKLIDQGIAGLTNTVNNALYDATNSFSDVDINSQSSYDVLGIQSDGFGDSSTPTTTIDYGNVSGDNSFIGGPEDKQDGLGGPQIIIDLKNNLEENIILANEEKQYFDQINQLRSQSKETVINLDQCLPGPDYGWENRFRDEYFSLITEIRENDSEEEDKDYIELNSQVTNLGLANTKKMFDDPKVNIPGSIAMKDSIETIVGNSRRENARNNQRTNTLSKTTSTLSYIRAEILSDFNTQKSAYNDNLVLFYEDWDNLSTQQQESAFETASNNGYSSLRAADNYVTTNNQLAASAVISMSWNIWRAETPKEKKSELRQSFYVLQGDLSSEEFVARVKAQYNRINTESFKAKQLLQDCLVLKSYVLGKDLALIQSDVNTGDPSTISGMDANINRLLLYPPIQPEKEDFGTLQETSFINLSRSRSDPQVKSFLQQEGNKQLNNNPSIFLTSAITQDIQNSILSFDSVAEKKEYFANIYPEIEFESGVDSNYYHFFSDNQTSLNEMYRLDRFWVKFPKFSGLRGVVFCRHGGEIQLERKLGEDMKGTACLADWYIATDLDYSLAIAGI